MKRIIHSIVPAFLLSVSVGQIYAFTNFSTEISLYIGETQKAVQVAFSLGIFFLGMGAAFFGKIVEKNIRLSTFIGMALFISGLFTTAIGISTKSIETIYIGYGLLLGLGTGVIYITPVKTMMLWFPNHKAIAAAIPIISFGLGSTLSTVIYKGVGNVKGLYDVFAVANGGVGIINVFYAFAIFYFLVMFCAAFMLRKPDGIDTTPIGGLWLGDARVREVQTFSYLQLMKDKFFIRSWFFMFLNISAGLGLIPLAKQMMDSPEIGYMASTITMVIGLCGIMNGGGRFFFAWWSDHLKVRRNIMILISGISFLAIATSLKFVSFIGVTLLIINACYGAGFSIIPAVLSDHYGMKNISKIHGAVLSAWGVAGLVGNQVAILVGDRFGGYEAVLVMLGMVYMLNTWNSGKLSLYSEVTQDIVHRDCHSHDKE